METENENAESAGNNSNNNATKETEAGKSDDQQQQQQPQLQPGTSGIQHAQTQGVYIEKQLTSSRKKTCKAWKYQKLVIFVVAQSHLSGCYWLFAPEFWEVTRNYKSFFFHSMNAVSVVGIPWGGEDTQTLPYAKEFINTMLKLILRERYLWTWVQYTESHLQWVKQECIPLGCVPPALDHFQGS